MSDATNPAGTEAEPAEQAVMLAGAVPQVPRTELVGLNQRAYPPRQCAARADSAFGILTGYPDRVYISRAVAASLRAVGPVSGQFHMAARIVGGAVTFG
jgi:hypothetical protein